MKISRAFHSSAASRRSAPMKVRHVSWSKITAYPQIHTAPTYVTVLGSTGSIGCNTLKLIEGHPARFSVQALTAMNNVDLLIAQALRVKPRFAAIANPAHYSALKEALSGTGIETAAGEQAIMEAASYTSDVVMSAIVGAAGLTPTLAAIRRGATVALANKECLVCAGEIIMREVKKYNATLLPVDSEHSAIFQLFDFNAPETVEKITITGSGGPFRNWSLEQMKEATPEQATRHPKWNMGAKISVDSATLMNKGLEMIEAFHLFPVAQEQIDIIIHPESIIHGMVSYVDGSVMAAMASPDMCTPIAHALAWPERISAPTKRLDFTALGTLTFEKPDEQKFPALALARAALKNGGTAPAILNAANEVAVQRFLNKEIGFLDIARVVEATLAAITYTAVHSLQDIIHTDNEARQKAGEF